MKNIPVIILLLCTIGFSACKKADETTQEPKLIFKFKFDSTQVRLDGFGNPSVLAANHGAQSPTFNSMSSHYVELAPTAFTALGDGAVLYRNEETTSGGANAIDFSKSVLAGNNETFLSVPIKDIVPGSYQYLRVSLAYQNYNIDVRAETITGLQSDITGTLASFIGFNSYIRSFKVSDSTVTLNANKKQGYWAFETRADDFPYPVQYLPALIYGQVPEGATTVPNPIAATSPIPLNSCVVTGAFANPFVITGTETSDITVVVSLSTKQSFEWVEHSQQGFYEPAAGDTVVDMGIRGLIPIVQ